jgi:hypothetical protein
MRSRRVRTIVALAPILIAVLVAASAAASGRDRGPQPPTTPAAAGLGSAHVPPAAIATPNPTRSPPTTTTRRTTTTTTRRPVAADGPSGPRLLFGMGRKPTPPAGPRWSDRPGQDAQGWRQETHNLAPDAQQ